MQIHPYLTKELSNINLKMKACEHLNLKGKYSEGAWVGTTDDGSSAIVTVIIQENYVVFHSRQLPANLGDGCFH